MLTAGAVLKKAPVITLPWVSPARVVAISLFCVLYDLISEYFPYVVNWDINLAFFTHRAEISRLSGMRLMPSRTECCLMGRAAFFLKPCLFFVISVGSAAVLHRVASPLLSVSLSLLRPTSVFMLTEFPTASVKWLSFTLCIALTPVLLRLLAGVGLTRSREAPVGWGGKFCLLCLVVSHQVVGVLLVMKVLAPFHQNYFTRGHRAALLQCLYQFPLGSG